MLIILWEIPLYLDVRVKNITFTTTTIDTVITVIISFVFQLKNQAIRFYNMNWTSPV